ncbi:hypothetical protein HBB16_14165, partial [Pseudonocardia sp. MCCB 268]|nr:hypothetical protein [Pseudonocardia cytotoxica]
MTEVVGAFASRAGAAAPVSSIRNRPSRWRGRRRTGVGVRGPRNWPWCRSGSARPHRRRRCCRFRFVVVCLTLAIRNRNEVQ